MRSADLSANTHTNTHTNANANANTRGRSSSFNIKAIEAEAEAEVPSMTDAFQPVRSLLHLALQNVSFELLWKVRFIQQSSYVVVVFIACVVFLLWATQHNTPSYRIVHTQTYMHLVYH